MAIVTPTDHPTSFRNRCVIEFWWRFCVVTLLFGFFCWCKGICNRTESDLFLFLIKMGKFIANKGVLEKKNTSLRKPSSPGLLINHGHSFPLDYLSLTECNDRFHKSAQATYVPLDNKVNINFLYQCVKKVINIIYMLVQHDTINKSNK